MHTIPLLWAGLGCGTTLAKYLLASHYTGDIYSLELDDGKLSIKSSVKAGGQMPSWLTLDSDRGIVYVTDEAAWAGDTALTAVKVTQDGGLDVVESAMSPGGDLHSGFFGQGDGMGFIAVAQYDPSSISTYALPLTDSSPILQTIKFTMSGPGPVPSRQDKPHPHSVFPDPTNDFLLSADLGADVIHVMAIASDGKLTECLSAKAGPGDGPRHGAFAADGNALYVVNELSNSLSKYSVGYPAEEEDGGCLDLQLVQTISTFPDGEPCGNPNGCKAAEVHVRDRFIYVANRNDVAFGPEEDSIAVFADEGEGMDMSLEMIQLANSHAWFPRTFQINKAGDMVAVAGQTSSNVAVVKRDPETGMLGDLIDTIVVASAGNENQEDGLSAVIWDE